MNKGIIGLLAAVVVVIVGLYAGFGMKETQEAVSSVDRHQTTTVSAAEPAAGEPAAANGNAVDAPAKTYIMGSPDAPVKIKEFASLSCSHCAHFHKETFPQIKKDLIDTGKVQFEFVNFPLNAPAMDGALVALCMPEERYHQFISFLFEQQDKWAFDQNSRQILKQNAKLLGASEDKLDACLNNEDMKQGIVSRMQEAQKAYNIQSTPSFVINDKETFSGALEYPDFKKKVEAHMQQEKVEQ
ncbi:MAG: DsbA family protein [Micavibrio aeruginosavorus]|uniref:DsbA family protein n=1 Tax=Micavibrio aeruginosavorus TaxID=349221 RepID=A0A7T5R0S0_9BACT|nr:MAG: DsbA family protein [Micavibrio aeruginosavorus]